MPKPILNSQISSILTIQETYLLSALVWVREHPWYLLLCISLSSSTFKSTAISRSWLRFPGDRSTILTSNHTSSSCFEARCLLISCTTTELAATKVAKSSFLGLSVGSTQTHSNLLSAICTMILFSALQTSRPTLNSPEGLHRLPTGENPK